MNTSLCPGIEQLWLPQQSIQDLPERAAGLALSQRSAPSRDRSFHRFLRKDHFARREGRSCTKWSQSRAFLGSSNFLTSR